MKPLFRILGLTEPTMEKISLEKYRLLKDSARIWVLPPYGKWPEEMKREGLNVSLITPEDLIELLGTGTKRQFPDQDILLVIPGYVLPEGALVKKIKALGQDDYELSLEPVPPSNELDRLVGIMAELRSRQGCPWDKEQTHESLKKYLIEETYEVIEAIEIGDLHNFCEELGDLLLQIIFHAQIATENGGFDISKIIEGIAEKLIRRHPHVFGNEAAATSTEVLESWEKIKRAEKKDQVETGGTDYFHLPLGLPSLMLAEKTQKKAGKAGFDWDSYEGPLAKVEEETAELKQAIALGMGREEELGDLLFSIVNLARFFQIDSEEALRSSTQKFQKRFRKMLELMAEKNLSPEGMDLEQFDIYWEQAKK